MALGDLFPGAAGANNAGLLGLLQQRAQRPNFVAPGRLSAPGVISPTFQQKGPSFGEQVVSGFRAGTELQGVQASREAAAARAKQAEAALEETKRSRTTAENRLEFERKKFGAAERLKTEQNQARLGILQAAQAEFPDNPAFQGDLGILAQNDEIVKNAIGLLAPIPKQFAPTKPSTIDAKLISEGLTPGTPEAQVRAAQLNDPRALVKLQTVAETTREKGIAERSLKREDAIDAELVGATESDSNLNRMDSALEALNTGLFGEEILSIEQFGAQFGIDLAPFFGEDPGTVPRKELVQTITNQMVINTTKTATGGGLGGRSFSDADRNFTLKTVPGLSKTPGGNRLIIQMQRLQNDRIRLKSRMADDYILEHGELDRGWAREWSEFAKENPIYTPEFKDAVDTVADASEQTSIEDLSTLMDDVGIDKITQ